MVSKLLTWMQSHECFPRTVVHHCSEEVTYSGSRRGRPPSGRRSRTCSGHSAGPPRCPCRHIVLWQTHRDPRPETPLGHSHRLCRGREDITWCTVWAGPALPTGKLGGRLWWQMCWGRPLVAPWTFRAHFDNPKQQKTLPLPPHHRQFESGVQNSRNPA